MSKQTHYHALGYNGSTSDAIGDYSSVASSFKLSPSEEVLIHRLIIGIVDTGSFDANKYGNGIILTNGIRIYHRDTDDALIQELTAFPIKSNGDWQRHCHDLEVKKEGTGDEVGSVRWTFSKSGLPVKVNGPLGEYIEVLLNDDFSGLVAHSFLFEGIFDPDYSH